MSARARRGSGKKAGKSRPAPARARPRGRACPRTSGPSRWRSTSRSTRPGAAFRGDVTHRLRLDGRCARSSSTRPISASPGARITAAGGRRCAARLVAPPDVERVEITFAEPVPAGEAVLELAFAGKLRGDLRGLYAARSGERAYAFTQLEAADARRFFPCFDEPALKARFQLSVTTAQPPHRALERARRARSSRSAAGASASTSSATPPLSTYLLALAVGELEASGRVRCGDTEIRVWHVPGKGHLTGFALEAARESLARLEAYFGLPYPYAKLDLVAVPDFEAGAMENAGAVFFRETLLLVDPATVTLAGGKRVAEVICHELAHMWYGDLVTMAWWDDLWLNEAFATWMAFHVVDDWKPEWKMWNDFQHHRAAALAPRRARPHAPDLHRGARRRARRPRTSTLITYEKGASVVRMVERYLGAETFRAGVRAYIREHQEANAVAADLWSALARGVGPRRRADRARLDRAARLPAALS